MAWAVIHVQDRGGIIQNFPCQRGYHLRFARQPEKSESIEQDIHIAPQARNSSSFLGRSASSRRWRGSSMNYFCFICRYDPHHLSFDQRLTKSTTLALPATTPRVRAAKMEANGNLHPLPRKLIFCGWLQSRAPVCVILPTSAAFSASRRAANDDFGFGRIGIEKEDFLKPLFVVEIGLEPRKI
jgi:hypothetical protein